MNKRKELMIINSLGAMSSINPQRLSQLIVAGEEFLNHFDVEVKMRGKVSTLALYKDIYSIAKCLSMNMQYKPLSFRKSRKDGLPFLLRGLEPFLLGDLTEKRLALTITRSFESIMLKPDPDFNPITSEKPEVSQELRKDFAIFLDEWIPRILPKGTRRLAYHMQGVKEMSPTRSGPNGPGLITSHYDAYQLTQQPNLLKAIQTLQNALFLRIEAIAKLVQPHKEFILSKIAVLPQSGGKSRIIAIGDYWSQLVLKPIHNEVMSILRTMKTDGTYNQDKQSERIRIEAGNESHSFDLSNATDTFPISLQKELMDRLYNPTTSGAWQTLISDRQFLYKPTNTIVRWATGQPLGLYSSWAVFSLTHHAFIEYCAKTIGINSFRSYAVLGDDVVIWDKKVSDVYRSLMEKINVKINHTKSIISDESNVRVEFAKRLFYNHEEISGLSWNLIKSAGTSIHMFVSLLRVSKLRNWEIKLENFSNPGYLSTKGNQLLNILIWEFSNGQLPLQGGWEHKELAEEPSVELIKLQVAKLRLQSLKDKMEAMQEVLSNNKSLQELFAKGGITVSPQLLAQGRVMHPLMYTLNDLEQISQDCFYDLEQYISDLEQGQEGDEPPPLPIEYFPSVNTSAYFGDRQVLSQMFRSSMVLKAFFELYNPKIN